MKKLYKLEDRMFLKWLLMISAFVMLTISAVILVGCGPEKPKKFNMFSPECSEAASKAYQNGRLDAAKYSSPEYDEAYYEGHEDACNNPKVECNK